MKCKTHKQMLADLIKANPSASAVFREHNTDLEDAVEAAGGRRGSVRA